MTLEILFNLIVNHIESGGVVIAGYQGDDFVVKDIDYVPLEHGLSRLAFYKGSDLVCALILSDRVDTLSEVVGGVVTYTFSDMPQGRGSITFLTKCDNVGATQP